MPESPSDQKDSKKAIAKGRKAGRPALGPQKRKIILTLRGSDKFSIWLKKLAMHTKCNQSELIYKSTSLYAKSVGFTIPPTR
jgi:hypothetical protein